MIEQLHISNYAIIERLDLDFSKKLTIITGETGAGKSIMLGALGLIMGKRADIKALYNTENKCVVEAHFNIKPYDLQEFFEEQDLEYDDHIIIRREISVSGKSRAFINDSPATIDALQLLSGQLLDLHQQFDTLDIQSAAFQLKVIDALADNKDLNKQYRTYFKKYKALKSELNRLIEGNKLADQQREFLDFQYQELAQAELVENELSGLETELQVLSNAEDIKRQLLGASHQLMESEQNIVGQLKAVANSIQSVAKFHNDLPKLNEQLLGFIMEIQELNKDFERIADRTENNPERQNEVQTRLNTLYKLLKKHNVSEVSELIALQLGLEKQLSGFNNATENIAKLEKEIGELEKQCQKLAISLSERRLKAIEPFEKEVHKLLSLVAMEHAQLKVQQEPTAELTAEGLDHIRFLFAANKGSRLQEIKGYASGGELSRLAFCIKSMVAASIPLPTIIFDEIDSGISGDVAMKMGNILKQLADHHQLISITHSPQIASKASKHYFVYKQNTPERTLTAVRALNPTERIYEIAKMLSGDPPSESAKQNASDLIAASQTGH